MAVSLPEVSTARLERQVDVLTTAQAVRLYGPGYVRSQLAARRWQRSARAVVVKHNGPLTQLQQAWTALLTCADGSVLGGLTALELDGLEGFESAGGRYHVVLPEGAARPASRLVIPHWSTQLSERDVHPTVEPPRTRRQRSLVDEAAWSRQPRRARAVILAGVQQGFARPGDLRDALSRRGNCRHRALIKQSIMDADGGVQSLPERDFDAIRVRFGLPRPSRQAKVQRPDGHFFLDLKWDAFAAAAEIHGVPHMAVLNWDRDIFRANEITIAGPRLLVFSSYAVRQEPNLVGDQLVRLLRRQGWAG